MRGKSRISLTPAKAGVHGAKWIPAFAGMSGLFAMLAPAFAQQDNANPIPPSGGALIMPKEQLPDPVEAGWQCARVCKVVEENDRQRALECAFPRGGGHERHFHAPHFGYVLQGGKMRITDKTGTRDVDLKSGDTWTSDGVDWHEVLNVGKTEAIYLIVEPKEPK